MSYTKGVYMNNNKNKMKGLRFGRLMVVGPSEDKLGRWSCQCDCGNLTIANMYDLEHGRKKSCGCYGKEIHRKDITGLRFGRLTVLYSTAKIKRESIVWVCQCECGNIIEECCELLMSGHKKSCGCLQIESAQAVMGLARTMILVDDTNLGLIQSHNIPKHNTSGVRGVHWDRKQGKWIAQIKFQKRTIRLGTFDSIIEAADERRLAEQRIFGKYLESKGIEYH